MSDVEDSHSADSTNNEVTNNEQYRRPMPDNTHLTKRPKLDHPSQALLIEDILHHIFSFFNTEQLVKMSRVCKAWQVVSRQKIKFLSTASFYDPGVQDPDPEQSGCNVGLMRNVLELTDKTVKHVSIQGSDSNDLGSELNPEVCQILSDNCPNLKTLTLCNIKMSHIFCSTLGKCLPPKLKTLEIHECYELEDHSFGKILSNCKNLKKLVILFHLYSDANNFRGLSIIEHLEPGQLKMLCLDINSHGMYLFRILEKFKSSLRQLILQCSVIEKYDFVDFKFNFLEAFKLVRFGTDDNSNPSKLEPLYSNLNLLLNTMPNLDTLELQSCSFIANKQCYFKLLPKRVPLLKELRIVKSLPTFRKHVSFLPELENLETLFLSSLFSMYDDRHCDSDDDNHVSIPVQAKVELITHLVAVIIKCPKLKTVIFVQMPMLNDDHVFTMISSMPTLRHLKVKYSTTITGSFVSKCGELDRTCPIEVQLDDHEGVVKDLPPTPPFLELSITDRTC